MSPMSTHIPTAEQRRQQTQAYAQSLGVDEDYISELVDAFYHRIRQNDRLGPIFEEKMRGQWDLHLLKMKQFWSSVALSSGKYSGQPVPKHQVLSTVTANHFDIWLDLFEQALRDTAPSPEVIPYFMERAQRIAESLKLAMFGLPNLPLKPKPVQPIPPPTR